MSKNSIFKKNKLKKFAQEITVGGREVKTRMSKTTFQKRASEWDSFYSETAGGDYADFVNWGAEGGRPAIYENHKDKIQAYRLRKKLKESKELSNKQIEWLRMRGINFPKNNALANIP